MITPFIRNLRIQCPWLDDEGARLVLQQVATAAITTIIAGDPVKLPGLGKFVLFHALARKGRNPRNPAIEILIPAKQRVKFTPLKSLCEAVAV